MTAVSRTGYYLPWGLFSGAVTAVGNGLISTFSPTTDVGKYVGYQIIVGAGRGAGMQVVRISLSFQRRRAISLRYSFVDLRDFMSNRKQSIIAVQNALPAHQIPVGLAFLVFCQNMSGAISVVVATTIFTQSVLSDIVRYAPSVSPDAALAAGGGSGAVRALVPPGSPELEGVLLTFSNGIDRIFYMLAGLAVAGFVFAWGMGWKDVRKKKDAISEPDAANEKATV